MLIKSLAYLYMFKDIKIYVNILVCHSIIMTTSQIQQLEIETLTASITALAEGVNSAMLAGNFEVVQRKTKMMMVLKERLLSRGVLN